jgi:hypothetical protein
MKAIDARKADREHRNEKNGLTVVTDEHSKFVVGDALAELRKTAAEIDVKVAQESAEKREVAELSAIANYHGKKAQDKAAKQAESARAPKGTGEPTEAQIQGAQPGDSGGTKEKSGNGGGKPVWKPNK